MSVREELQKRSVKTILENLDLRADGKNLAESLEPVPVKLETGKTYRVSFEGVKPDQLMPEVRDHDPHLALSGGAAGLDFYRRIVREAGVYLKRGGLLLMEVGEGEAETVAEWLRNSGAGKTEIRKDDAGISRMVLGEFV